MIQIRSSALTSLRYWLDSPDNLKRAVAWKAVELVKRGFALEVLIIGMAIEELGNLIPQNARLV